jgi:hypothetical protein
MPNCVCVSDLRVYIRLLGPHAANALSTQSNESHDRDPRWRDVAYSRRDPRRFPARAASMNLFPAEGRKSLPRIHTTANLLVNRQLSAVEIGEVLAPAALVRLFRLRGKSEW